MVVTFKKFYKVLNYATVHCAVSITSVLTDSQSPDAQWGGGSWLCFNHPGVRYLPEAALTTEIRQICFRFISDARTCEIKHWKNSEMFQSCFRLVSMFIRLLRNMLMQNLFKPIRDNSDIGLSYDVCSLYAWLSQWRLDGRWQTTNRR